MRLIDEALADYSFEPAAEAESGSPTRRLHPAMAGAVNNAR